MLGGPGVVVCFVVVKILPVCPRGVGLPLCLGKKKQGALDSPKKQQLGGVDANTSFCLLLLQTKEMMADVVRPDGIYLGMRFVLGRHPA